MLGCTIALLGLLLVLSWSPLACAWQAVLTQCALRLAQATTFLELGVSAAPDSDSYEQVRGQGSDQSWQ